MQLQARLFALSRRLERAAFVRTIRGGLITIIPILMIGAFALIGRSFPITAYAEFIHSFAGGLLYMLFDIVYFATFGMLSLYMTAAISQSYLRERPGCAEGGLGAPFAALSCFFILSGVFEDSFSLSAFGAQGMITALVSGYLGTAVYCRAFSRRKRQKTYADGVDLLFNNAMAVIWPAAFTALCFALAAALIPVYTGADTFYALIIQVVGALFEAVGGGFWGGLLLVVGSSLLWFFGIHGSDCLEGVMQNLYAPAIQTNLAAVAAGGEAPEILTKQFFDIFVLMGGCGTAMCLLLSLLFFSQRKSSRQLSRVSVFPMLFNINETMIFGLPVILNPILFLPFVLTPTLCYLVSYFALYSGLVGKTIAMVEWTTPVLLGGYIATGSVAGGLLQLFNLGLGVLLYAPFVRMLDRQKLLSAKEDYQRLVEYYKTQEARGVELMLTEQSSSMGEIAKRLALDISEAIDHDRLPLYYQPQYAYDGRCLGAEALLRFEHELLGFVYPPLIIRIAKEAGLLGALERSILLRAVAQREQVRAALGEGCIVSVNLTGDSFAQDGFTEFLRSLAVEYGAQGLCLEITEQTALHFDERTVAALAQLRELGFLLAIDDFSMGQTSINYLKDSHFDQVKLDGSLVTDIEENPRSAEIIASIVALSEALGFTVMAEYVENEHQREILARAGCLHYQGYLYSPAVPLSQLGLAAGSADLAVGNARRDGARV